MIFLFGVYFIYMLMGKMSKNKNTTNVCFLLVEYTCTYTEKEYYVTKVM